MKIFIDARVLNSKEPSGIAEYGRLIIEHLLAAAGNDEFIFFVNSFRKFALPSFLSRESTNLIDYRIPNRLWDLSARFFNFPKIDELAPAEVYYSPNINILAFGDHRPRVMTIHDLSFIHHPEFFGRRERLWHWRQDYRRQIGKVGRIIAVSEFTRQDVVQNFDLPAEKVTTVHSGINPFYQPLKLPPPERPFIFYLGKIEPRKNIVGLIQAFNVLKKSKNFQDFRLIIAGGRGWLYDRIFKEAAVSPYAADIKFLGAVSQEKARELYNLASVFVYPSFYEGFGFPPLEAQACGLPVIASDAASLPEILKDSALLINPFNVEDLAAAVGKVLTNRSFRSGLVAKGLENVKNYSWRKTAQQCLKLFRQKI